MTLLVPYDGSALADAALRRATEFGDVLDQDVIALAAIPTDPEYARERGWINEDEEFEPELFELELRDNVNDIAPAATFLTERPTDPADEPFSSTTMNIVRTIRRVAGEVDADILFLGSENAGKISRPLTSVGAPLSNDPRYDVHIVRHAD